MKRTLAIVFILVLLVSGLTYAHGGIFGSRFGYDEQNEQNEILTEEEKEEIFTVRENHFEKQEAIFAELAEKQEELDLLLQDYNADREEISSLQDEVDDLRSELQELRLEEREEIKDLLSAEQWEQLNEYGNFNNYHRQGFTGHPYQENLDRQGFQRGGMHGRFQRGGMQGGFQRGGMFGRFEGRSGTPDFQTESQDRLNSRRGPGFCH